MMVIEPLPERAEIFLKLKNNAGIMYRSIYLKPVPYYSHIS